MSDKLMKDTYLGDGVYASFDGYQIWLDLRGQDRTTKIALDPRVVEALFAYIQEIENAKDRPGSQPHTDSKKSS